MSRRGRAPARADGHDRLRMVDATIHDHLPTLFTPDSRKGLANVRLYALGISERPVEDGFHGSLSGGTREALDGHPAPRRSAGSPSRCNSGARAMCHGALSARAVTKHGWTVVLVEKRGAVSRSSGLAGTVAGSTVKRIDSDARSENACIARASFTGCRSIFAASSALRSLKHMQERAQRSASCYMAFATDRRWSANRRTTGPIVRCFSVTSATDRGSTSRSMGNALSDHRFSL